MSVINSTLRLHPEFRLRCEALHKHLILSYETGVTKTLFKIFETYRSPERQSRLLAQKTTKAGPWESPHQWGFAADFVPYLNGREAAELAEDSGTPVEIGWNWHPANDYSFLATAAKRFQLRVPISWDLVHVESPFWPEYRREVIAPNMEYLNK